jgi:large subunit ribosomal protein L17
MRHRVYGRKLGRHTNHRIAMWRNMAIALFTHGQITTTIPKAKSLKPFVEKLISAAKKGDLASRRRVIKMIGDQIMVKSEDDPAITRNKYGEIVSGPKVVKTLFDEIAPKYTDRTGGYTRIIKLTKHRIGDGSSLCVLQLVGGDDEGGPQVSGQYSRRRDKANRRMERAASLRKGGAATAVAEPEAPAEEATTAPVEEAQTEAEATEEKSE